MQPDKIELGLERIQQVAKSAGLDRPSFRIITVAGTNGKGSTVAYCDAMLRHQGYRTGVYTSPHFIDFNERIVVGNDRVAEAALCEAFDRIDAVRADIPLTYFEFTTLAAMHCFGAAGIDVAILEVGLGGRLDAVNAWDAELACVSSIGIDHTDWLGDDREAIGREKAGVARKGKILVCGDPDPPQSIATTASDIGANLLQRDRDFSVTRLSETVWRYTDEACSLELPTPAIKGGWACDNAAVAICAIHRFTEAEAWPDRDAIEYALQSVTMTGRMQFAKLSGTELILDVAHNRAAAKLLADYLRDHPITGATHAVFGCMQDKDADAILSAMAPMIDHWCIAEIDYPRAMQAAEISSLVNSAELNADLTDKQPDTRVFTSVIQAVHEAVAKSSPDDRIVVFGSFHVVGPATELIDYKH